MLVPFVIAAMWSATRSRDERANELRDQAASVAVTAAAYLNTYLTGLDSMASALTRHPAVMALDRRQWDLLFEAVLRDQPLILNISAIDLAGNYRGSGVPTTVMRAGPAAIPYVSE